MIWAWAGLLINGINSIPAGELDGGKIAFSIWGRKVTSDPNLNIPIFSKRKILELLVPNGLFRPPHGSLVSP